MSNAKTKVGKSLIKSTHKLDSILKDPEFEKVAAEMKGWSQASRKVKIQVGRFKTS